MEDNQLIFIHNNNYIYIYNNSFHNDIRLSQISKNYFELLKNSKFLHLVIAPSSSNLNFIINYNIEKNTGVNNIVNDISNEQKISIH